MSTVKASKIKDKSYSFSGYIFKHKHLVLRISIGLVFFWFGCLKFFPGLSPAEDLAIQTIQSLSFGLLPNLVIINGLALVEVIIGLGLISGKFNRVVLTLLFVHMAGTFAPVFLFPDQIFTHIPYGLTLKGQYIIKNVVLVAAAIVLSSNSRED